MATTIADFVFKDRPLKKPEAFRNEVRAVAGLPPALPAPTGAGLDRHRVTLEYLPVGRLVIPEEYQAVLQPQRVAQIAAHWDDEGAGTLEVSRRANGTEAVMDGMHRREALLMLGRPDHLMPCRVTHGLSLDDEIRIYRTLADRKNKTRVNLLRAATLAGDPHAVALGELLAERGLRLPVNDGGREKKQPGTVSSPGQLLSLVASHGPGHVGEVLDVVVAVWGTDRGSFGSDVLTGVSQFLRAYPDVGTERLVAKLRQRDADPAEVIRGARAMRMTPGTGTARGFAAGRAVLGIVNAGTRTGRLPDRFDDFAREERQRLRQAAKQGAS